MLPLIPIAIWLLTGAAAAAATVVGIAAVCVAVEEIRSIGDVKKAVTNNIKVNDVFKWRIEEAMQYSVNVGIFDREENKLEDLTLDSSSEVYENVINDLMKWQYI